MVSLWKEMKGKSKESKRKIKRKWKEMKIKKNKGKLSDPSPFNNILNNIQYLLVSCNTWYKTFLSLSWEVGVLVSLWKEMKGKSKESERKIKRKWKENKRKIKGKLSDPSPFNNILNNIQFLLAVVGIKHSYGWRSGSFG